MSITPERLLEIAARSPRAADILIATAPAQRAKIGVSVLADSVACWVQTVLPPDATQAQRTAARSALAIEAAKAVAARVWLRHVEVEEERIEGGRVLLTLYLFKGA